MMSEQSKSWEALSKTVTLQFVGTKLRGFPFNEGFPNNRTLGKIFEVIGSDGTKYLATLDLSKQYTSEGILWDAFRVWDGTKYISTSETFNKENVAGWKTYE